MDGVKEIAFHKENERTISGKITIYGKFDFFQ